MRYGLLDDVANYGGRPLPADLARGSQLWPELRILHWGHTRWFELLLTIGDTIVYPPGERRGRLAGTTFRAVGHTNREALMALERALVSWQRRRLENGPDRSVQ